MVHTFRLLTVTTLSLLFMSGCGKYLPALDQVFPDKRTEYKKTQTLPDLEVPPDLSTESINDKMGIPEGGKSARFSSYQERVSTQRKQREVEQAGAAAVQLMEGEQLIVASGAVAQIWPQLRSFWQENGFELSLDDEELGIMETRWQENEEELTRDRYELFAENGREPGTTLFHLSHKGEALTPQGEQIVWQTRPSDARLAERMADRLSAALQGLAVSGERTSPSQTRTPARSYATNPPALGSSNGATANVELISSGGDRLYLAVGEGFAESWKLTGDALTRAGIDIESDDRSRGIYTVRFSGSEAPPSPGKKGIWSKMAFWKGDVNKNLHKISVTGVGNKTEIVVLDDKGKWATSLTAKEILNRLQSAFNGAQ